MDPEAVSFSAAERYHYYDRYPTAEDIVGESVAQDQLLAYLYAVLSRMWDGKPAFVARNLNIYKEKIERADPITPDIALFCNVQISARTARRMASWRMYEVNRPAPTIVFESASKATWREDLRKKPAQYAYLGVTEYVLYDPNELLYVPAPALRLWRNTGAELQLVDADAHGRVWSTVLDSWLVADGPLVRLVDAHGTPHLTQAEAEQQARIAEQQARERAWAKLRELGIDPTTLE